MKTIKNICAALAFFLFLIVAACADGIMDAYGMGATCLVFLGAGLVGLILVSISNLPEVY